MLGAAMSALLDLLMRRKRLRVESPLAPDEARRRLARLLDRDGPLRPRARGRVSAERVRLRLRTIRRDGDVFWDYSRTPVLVARLAPGGAGATLEGVWTFGREAWMLLCLVPGLVLWGVLTLGFFIDHGALAGLTMAALPLLVLGVPLLAAEERAGRSLRYAAVLERALREQLEAAEAAP
jgi:hypothetical protein